MSILQLRKHLLLKVLSMLLLPLLGTARNLLTDTEAKASALQGIGKMYIMFS